MSLPDATANPCEDCPWRRSAARGWLGPVDADTWLEIAHSDVPVACHKRSAYVDGKTDWDDPETRQCRGLAIFRANICKSPRDPEVVSGPVDRERVFGRPDEFREHHHGSAFDVWQREEGLR
jgi:hypothetical protein